MSEIVFSADLDTGKLESSVKKSSQTIQDWAKGVENAGNKADNSFNKMADTIKNKVSRPFEREIKKEEGLITSLEKHLEELREKKKKAFTVEEIEKYNKKIQEAELHLKEYNNAGKVAASNNQDHAKSQSSIISGLGKWAIGLATVTGALKFFKGVLESTERTGESFRATMAGAKAGLDYFMKSIASAGNGGFVGFGLGLVSAIKAGKEFSKEESRIANIRNEYLLKTLDLNKEIEEQRRIFYEDDKTSNAAKLEAADLMLKKMEEKANLEIELANKSYQNQAKLAESKNRMSEEDIKFAIENYQRVEEIGGAYNRLNYVVEQYNKAKKEGTGIGGDSNKQYVAINKFSPFYAMDESNYNDYTNKMNELGPDAAKLGQIFASLEMMSDKERKVITDGIAAVKSAENQYLIESKRVFKEKENITDRENDNNKRLADNLRDLNNEIAALRLKSMEREMLVLKQQYDIDMEAAVNNQEMKTALIEKYALQRSEIEQKYLEQTKKENEKFITETEKLFSGQGYSMLRKAIINSGGKPTDYGSLGNLRASNIPEQTEIELERRRKLDELESKRRDKMLEILAISQDMTSTLFQQGMITEEAANQFDAMVSAASNLLTGNVPGAVMNVLQNLLVNIQQTFPGVMARESQRLASKIEEINRLLEEQRRIIELSERQGGKDEALKGEGDLLQNKIDANNAAIAKYQKIIDNPLKFVSTKRKAQEQINELIEANKELQIELEDSSQALNDLLSGGITENTIADTIAQGFREGRTSIDDFAAYMNDVLLDAVLNVFKAEILGPEIEGLKSLITESLSDNVLTEDEKAKIDKKTKEIADKNKKLFDDLTGPLDLNGAQSAGLTGGIARQITEDTGRELTGLFRRFADDSREIKDYNKMGINHLINIERNTYNTVEELKIAVIELKAINSNTKPAYSAEV